MKKSEKTKLNILNTAIKIFYEKGYDGTTTKEIAITSNISEGIIFKYFNSKKELLTKCIYKLIADFSNEIIYNPLEKIIKDNSNSSFKEILKLIIYNRKRLFDKYFKHIVIVLNESKYHPEIRAILISEIMPKFNEISSNLIKFGIEKNEIRDDINNIVLIRCLISSVFTMFLNYELIPEISSGLKINEEIDCLIDIFFNGIERR
ncbi:MAG: TetR/AcrR family transcriptional regulator [Bacillota bacterium]|nr:TetR/AcrR family transcriptional regulator [Bacillota bacterium]